jgi:putative transposase
MRATRDAFLCEQIEAVFFDPLKGRSVAGARKVWHLLACDGIEVARCTVERLMAQMGLRGVRRDAKRVITTTPDPAATTRPPDLVKRQFHASRPNQLWVVDFSYVSTWEGTAFTAFVQDVFGRKIVGWRVARSMHTELPLDALEMAIWVRDRNGDDIVGVTHHSDAGSQYTAIRYATRLENAGAVASIGTVGDSYDNAMAESINGLYKAECVKLEGPWRTVDQLELATCAWVEYWNNHRLHSAIGYLTPTEFEAAYHQQHTG